MFSFYKLFLNVTSSLKVVNIFLVSQTRFFSNQQLIISFFYCDRNTFELIIEQLTNTTIQKCQMEEADVALSLSIIDTRALLTQAGPTGLIKSLWKSENIPRALFCVIRNKKIISVLGCAEIINH